MTQELLLHVGDCKTGSTALQSVLSQGAWRAPGQSLLYTARMNHSDMAKTLTRQARRQAETKRFGAMRKAMEDSDARHVVISSEHFEFVDPEVTHAACLKHFPGWAEEMRVVAYVRPHAERLLSSYAEHVKLLSVDTSMRGMFERFQRVGRMDYAPRFRKWRDLLGDRFILRPMVRPELVQGDVVADFFDILFRGAGVEITHVPELNTASTVEDLAVLRALHRQIRAKYPEIRFNWHEGLGKHYARILRDVPVDGGAMDGVAATKLGIDRALAKDVVRHYRADAGALDAEFFDGTPMTDALEAAPARAIDAPQSLEPEDHFAPETIRYLAGFADMMGRMLADNPKTMVRGIMREELRPDT